MSNTEMSKIELYTRIIKAQSGVLYVRGKPGTAKSAIFKKVAKNQGWNFIDIRLSQRDSAEVGGYPTKTTYNGKEVMVYAYPKYLVEACEKPTLVCFDELNRASLETRNAALQILNERQIGDLKLNENVFMVALGNLGEEDGCEVEEFDMALNNRLIHRLHDLTFPEWVRDYAKENVNPAIVSFLENNLSWFYKAPTNTDSGYTGAYPTPRSWSYLSDLLGKETQPAQFLSLVEAVGDSYVGAAIPRFIRYCRDTMQMSIIDVINDFDRVAADLKDTNKTKRDKKSELLNELKKLDIVKYKKEQITNICRFLHLIDPDERTGYLNDLIDKVPAEAIKGTNLTPLFKMYQGDYTEIETLTKKTK